MLDLMIPMLLVRMDKPNALIVIFKTYALMAYGTLAIAQILDLDIIANMFQQLIVVNVLNQERIGIHPNDLLDVVVYAYGNYYPRR